MAVLKIRKIHLLLISLLSGLLLSAAWPRNGFPGFLFIALIPMLFMEDHISKSPDRFIKFSVLLYSYPGFLAWNILTTWWIVNSTLVGALLANVLNALFMAVIFQLFHWTKKKTSYRLLSYIAIVCYWVALEYLHLNWDLNWPWLNLGNGFSSYYNWVQWYEFTGTFGGTLWVLVANILIYEFFSNIKIQSSKFNIQYSLIILLWIATPIITSRVIYNQYKETPNPVNFVVVQPNLDPYSEQYTLPPPEVIGHIISLAGPNLNDKVNFLVAPESAIQEGMWENDLRTFASIRLLRQIIEQYPGLNILIGGSTFFAFERGEPIPRSARKFTDTDRYYNAYNAAIMINSLDTLQLYHKSKLTPGVEILPSFKGFKWLEKYAINLGGTVGSLGMDSVRKVYTTIRSVPVGPAICYESIFGEFFAEFVKNGAQIMIIITNDGWWGNTAGHRQHYAFAHLRAIETRRSIARSANTGISAFIDQRGDAHQVTKYWEPAVIKGSLNANTKLTFYVRHGDYIARYLTAMGIMILLLAVFISVKKRFLR
jgi:apolipoprotein N-acyltransferase